MRVTISSGLTERIVALAAETPSQEVCGLLLGSGDSIDDILVAANVAVDTECAFEVDPAVQFAALRAGRAGGQEVIGNFHSHPSGVAKPSECDRSMIGRIGEFWLITDGVTVLGWRADTLTSFAEVELVETTAGCAAS